MSFIAPNEIVVKINKVAQAKHETSIINTLVLSFLAGGYIAMGGLLAVVIGGGVPEIAASNPGLQKLLFGAVFPLGLILCAIAGADLFTGNTAYFIPSVMSKNLKPAAIARNWSLVYIGNLLGSLFVALFIAYYTDIFKSDPWHNSILNIADAKTSAPFYKAFLKGMACNWMVALAMWLAYAANDISGKILGIWFPIMAFVTMGFEHSIANMFFIPTAIFYGSDVTWSSFIVDNLIPVTLGNIVGGSVLTGFMYWFVFQRK